MPIVLVAAVAENGVIGAAGGLPWTLGTDLKRFKADTIGKPIIMGRKTFDSIGRPLPGRANVVVTRDPSFRAEGIDVAGSLGDAIRLAEVRGRCLSGAGEICIIGGGEIYRQAIDRADALHITHVLAVVEGDTHFPPIDPANWIAVRSEETPAGPRDSHPTRYVVYRRAGATSA